MPASSLELPLKCSLPVIVLLTALGIGVAIICLSLGYTIVFPNLFYLPIILTCMCFTNQGQFFTTCLGLTYIALVLIIIPKDSSLIAPAVVRVIFFELVAAVIVFLAKRRMSVERILENQKDEIDRIIKNRTDILSSELGQSLRLAHAYRETAELYERGLNQLSLAFVQWNIDMYITYTNPTFEKMVGRTKSDLIGRKISALPFLEEAWRNQTGIPVKTEMQMSNGSPLRVLWVFSDLIANKEPIPTAIVAIGMEIGKMEASR